VAVSKDGPQYLLVISGAGADAPFQANSTQGIYRVPAGKLGLLLPARIIKLGPQITDFSPLPTEDKTSP